MPNCERESTIDLAVMPEVRGVPVPRERSNHRAVQRGGDIAESLAIAFSLEQGMEWKETALVRAPMEQAESGQRDQHLVVARTR